MTDKQQRLFIFAGSYAEPEENGVHVYAFDENTGELTLTDQFAGLKNPTFLNVDDRNLKLYAISEGANSEGKKIGQAAAFAIDPAAGTLRFLSRADTVAAPTCHIQRDSDSRFLIVASYHGGMAGLVTLMDDGRIGKLLDTEQYEGHGANPERQDRPHPHSSFFSPDGKYLFIQDLGLDRINTYTIDAAAGKLSPHGSISTHPGAGPRHLVFRPDGLFSYVINEIDSTVTAFAYDADSGQLTSLETVSTLPEGFDGENTCAEITVSRDGKFLYGSNRGHDSIVIYSIDPASGKLTLVDHVSVQGAHPRHFALTPAGNYLIAANRDTNNIVTFRVHKNTGMLEYTGKSITVSKPVCVQPLYL
ncbi:lactonase family protein [Paenibacillus sp. sptzw28]|uniref:lactonase family protein n=1 Tax=Paenibacillus sp. sptzw28 TaxID=715179 RepID=UPI001C6F2747|nr:lactonase family protein [Paenibacillus sp. sptzw28]QYR22680.1 lactonase family protein [Paenibacillus sp. sptzw28]